jgi:predicted transcriptional regulator
VYHNSQVVNCFCCPVPKYGAFLINKLTMIEKELVSKKMIELNMSQNKLAQKSGVSQSQISGWLNDDTDLTITKFKMILVALGVEITYK